MRQVKLLFFTLVSTAVITACSSTPNVYSNTAPGADLSQYGTYGFVDNLSTDKESYRSMESNFLSVAVAQEMDARGYRYSENPDLLVNFYIHTEEKVQTRQVPTSSGYYGYRGGYYNPWGGYGAGMGYETRIDQFTQGTLNIDLVEARSRTLLWEGAITGRITESAIKNLEETVDEAVAAVFTQFPGRQPIPPAPQSADAS